MTQLSKLIINSHDKGKLKIMYYMLTAKGSAAFKICGEIRCALDGKLDREFVVDQWPYFSAIVGRPGAKNAISFLNNIYSFYAEDEKSFCSLIQKNNVIDWRKKISFSAVPVNLSATLEQEVLSKMGTFHNGTACHTLILDPTKYRERALPPNIIVTPLYAHDAEEVNSDWKYGDDKSLQFIKWQIENFLTICFRDKSSGEILAYMMQQWYGCLGMAYVKPKHRGRGISKHLMVLVKKIFENDMPVYSYVEVDNAVSIAAQKSIGCEIANCPLIYWCAYTPQNSKL